MVATTKEPLLEVDTITKSFGRHVAVSQVSFSVPAGAVCGFIGPNGAGKTTTMRIAATLELPDRGDVRVAGRSALLDPRGVRRMIGFMPDAYGTYAATTVAEYVDFFARAFGLKGKERLRAIDSVTDFTGLRPLLEKPISGLSKGMKQRLSLAKTLLNDPSILILDEPASGLDPRARVELRELIRILADQGKAVLVSSHILTELSEICDEVAVIESGTIQATGDIATLSAGADAAKGMQVRARFLTDVDAAQRFLAEQNFVVGTRREREGVVFGFKGDQEALADLLERTVREGLRPVEFHGERIDLEDLFLHLTQGKLQ
ncbi:putative ABC transporter ATP-binding protein YxlF [Planctomycetes bacterium Pla163]|uniref:Putative ABC transporter ATP-binding protein YxlF n=1 Tax=Rohdeia mirabilis TaxID=2528008 RepID=A0A518CYQ9_9BACT|nr:putative ABC transporter ATP-binding protein YxlF [Planctomycetes bacterium Pla163]